MPGTPKISDAEWEVMKSLWAVSPRSANEIVESLAEQNWTPPTIRTLINRLVKKGAASFTKSGREYLYTPKFSQEEYARQERRSFVRRVYDGAAQPMLVHFLEDEELSAEEVETLKRILDRKKLGSS